MSVKKEKKRLETLQNNFSSKDGFNSRLIDFRYQLLSKYFKGKTCLELGSADGEGTRHLITFFNNVTAVDASPKYIKDIKKNFPSDKVTPICSLFEELDLQEKFDTVMLTHILEHVEDPVNILKIAKKFLKKSGVLIADVPNANSINRLVGVKMGLLKNKFELHAGDIRIGHRRVYTLETLAKDIKKTGLRVTKQGGVFFKPVSNDQIEKNWTEEMIQGFLSLGYDFPELCSDIYVVCKQ
ncbi:MAG TPA: class I SAM-dependent methyltransferase [Candidatus Saccharimonadales bacterium]|nr:class I SAM-dependent methyltransferase [Candidatus Saccharimonadales bacterium]